MLNTQHTAIFDSEPIPTKRNTINIHTEPVPTKRNTLNINKNPVTKNGDRAETIISCSQQDAVMGKIISSPVQV
jgi:hypothetical protein